MKTIDDFLTLIQDELGLAIAAHELGLDLDEVAGWDSLHLLSLCTLLERETGTSLSLPDVLEARSLERIYTLAVSR
ncbi:phosphopantetheine-binding protein [Streptomyces sp. NPDC007983]|uniref:phosphopantetheine-binding protein n=1 Tax=Streptomyces sp. NPDC007983 TaxID=3364800 RepID=UPI0036EEAF1F